MWFNLEVGIEERILSITFLWIPFVCSLHCIILLDAYIRGLYLLYTLHCTVKSLSMASLREECVSHWDSIWLFQTNKIKECDH